MMHNIHNFVVNNLIYAGLNQLRLVEREKLVISCRYAYQLNS